MNLDFTKFPKVALAKNWIESDSQALSGVVEQEQDCGGPRTSSPWTNG